MLRSANKIMFTSNKNTLKIYVCNSLSILKSSQTVIDSQGFKNIK